MSSSKKKRPKLGVGDSSPSSSSFPILREPPPNLFPSKAETFKLIAVMAIAATVAFACNRAVLFFNRQPDPFCDTGEAPNTDLCEPCPGNGHCSNGQLVCSKGYKKIGRKCIEDGEINLTAKKFSEWVEHHVCNAYAQALCGDEAGKIWYEEPDVMKLLEHEARNSIVLKDDTFLFAKQKIMETLDNSLEKRAIINGSNQYKCPDMRAELHKPRLCRVRQWIYGHALLVVTFSIVFLGIIRFLWSLQRKKYLSSRAEQLYEQVCEILEDNAMTAKSMNKGEPWVVASWLRDHLLLPWERRDPKLWKKVEELLREDSRIDQYPKLVKGESKIVLEWQDGSEGTVVLFSLDRWNRGSDRMTRKKKAAYLLIRATAIVDERPPRLLASAVSDCLSSDERPLRLRRLLKHSAPNSFASNLLMVLLV